MCVMLSVELILSVAGFFFFYGEVNGTEDVHLSPARLPILFHAHIVPVPDKRSTSVNDSPESTVISVNDLEEVKSAAL